MAAKDKEAAALPEGQAEKPRKKSRIKRIVIILAILLMTLGGAGLGAYWWIFLRTPATEAPAPAAEAAPDAASNRRKVLVVDDSMTIRQAMKQLLQDDYEVTLVESGVAAIRTITLNRPDLILLDYEMPVCDGKQTLEMLRSEGSFAEIPVIFLTGRSDPNLVRELLALKPMGYLLKYLKPAEIKQKIDAYFERTKG